MQDIEQTIKEKDVEVFAVVHVRNEGNMTTFPKEINAILAEGYYIKSIDISPQSNGSSSLAYVVLRHKDY